MKLTLSSIVLLTITVALLWFTIVQNDSSPTATVDKKIVRSRLESAEFWSYNAEGEPNTKLRAASATSYTDSSTSYLTDLSLEKLNNNGSYWDISAKAGILEPQIDELQLTQKVKIREKNNENILITPRLRILLKQKKAMNHAPVTLLSLESTTTAYGINMDLNNDTTQLLRDVETVYKKLDINDS